MGVEEIVPGVGDPGKAPVAAVLRVGDGRAGLPVVRGVAVLSQPCQVCDVEEPGSSISCADLLDGLPDSLVGPRFGLLCRRQVGVRDLAEVAMAALVPCAPTARQINKLMHSYTDNCR